MSTLFLQSEVKNPYSFYQQMTAENPVYWDETHKIWALYSYSACVEILNHTAAHIPAFPANDNFNTSAAKIIRNLARLSNGIQHEIAKETAVILFSFLKNVGIDTILEELLPKEVIQNPINWVDLVCKKLPILTVLKSFDFNEKDTHFICEKITQLVKIMQPNKTAEAIESINTVSEEIYGITERHIVKLPFYKALIDKISASYCISLEEAISMGVSNLIGLFIQSYDAGRGLLSNSLLQILSKENLPENKTEKGLIQKMVLETLRFDPPIQNTRRMATEDIPLNKITIKKNDSILIVLAAANRDPLQFINAMNFDIERNNNHEHLTFGSGGHMCVAKHFSVHITTETLYYLFRNFNIVLSGNEITYEPLINVRLPKAIWISLYNLNQTL
ncbi:cytochrome P450 [Flavobacterium sp. LC2016-23]|uniref:cytochrome P450 n=1 Tax=Flavobacterium sp. LC2016-23 TaxID=2666330 RepID=UPI0012AFA798|nr:cytochrome P450 [Flavobacterium sp. LC2016-23]MRX38454.1 cytochrome P450 [Flavobacterium sp. LC2016-23]